MIHIYRQMFCKWTDSWQLWHLEHRYSANYFGWRNGGCNTWDRKSGRKQGGAEIASSPLCISDKSSPSGEDGVRDCPLQESLLGYCAQTLAEGCWRRWWLQPKSQSRFYGCCSWELSANYTLYSWNSRIFVQDLSRALPWLPQRW